MKKIAVIFVMILCMSTMCVGCTKESDSVIRIHIRANSNSDEDQSIKLKVRDNIITYITPLISECKNSNEVKVVLKENLGNIKACADEVLEQNQFEYTSNPIITNEFFPSRMYEDKVFESGYYDALIINLGSGVGNNWWCVAYPPLCFVGENSGGNCVKYRSKLVEIINNFFGK